MTVRSTYIYVFQIDNVKLQFVHIIWKSIITCVKLIIKIYIVYLHGCGGIWDPALFQLFGGWYIELELVSTPGK